MGRIFFAADHHFGHSRILEFQRQDGRPLRNFSSIEEHDEYLVDRHNSVVRDNDRVYLLGDVVLSRAGMSSLSRLRGSKRLISGNHDLYRTTAYLAAGVREVRGVAVFPEGRYPTSFVASHVPLHPSSLDRWKHNVHGHLHDREVGDSRYTCVSMEHLDDYKPIELGDLTTKIRLKTTI